MKNKLRLMGRVAMVLVLAVSLSLVMATPVMAAPLTAVSATPENATETVTTTYTIDFTTGTTGTIKYVDVEFHADFDVSGAGLGTITNIGAGTLSVDGQIVTYEVDSPASIAASTAITIELSGIVNPAADTYSPAVTVTTRDTYGVPIDTGTDDVTITSIPVSFLVEAVGGGGPITATAGAVFELQITAKDGAGGSGSTVTGYAGDYFIYFSSTATGSPTIPVFEKLTFVGGEVATTTVGFILTNASETPTITATDTAIAVSGTSAAITVDPATAHHLTITAPTSATAGVAFSSDVTVTAYDAYGNVATDDEETVNWTCDGTATAGSGLPADGNALVDGTYTFDKADFVLTEVRVVDTTVLDTTITATETAGTSLSAPATVTVNPAAASTLTAAADPASIAADGSDSSTITITAKDDFVNVDTNYSAAVTFETSLGTLSGVSTNFVSGVATANLTSTDVGGGTATVAVTSGTMDTTQDVALTDAPTEVWVDDTGNDNNPGTEALPFETIAAGITAAGVGGTVNVAPGEYTPASTLTIANDGVTLQSTGAVEDTIVDGTGHAGVAISITGDNVIVDGFAIESDDSLMGISIEGGDAIVRNNVVTLEGAEAVGIGARPASTDTTISNNTVVNATIYLEGEGNTVSGNSGGTINISTTSSDNDIIGNTLTDIVSRGIVFNGEVGTHLNNLIEGNTLSRNVTRGIHVEGGNTPTITNLTITGNTITDNGEVGILIDAGAVWGLGNTINNNNISGNLLKGIDNQGTEIIDAQNNWWGDATGPSTEGSGTGDAVSTYVDYTPWLTALYAEPTDPVTSISLESDWNFISVPRTMAADTDTFTELLVGIVYTIVWSYDPNTTDGWVQITSENEDVEVLEGYWIDVTTAGTVALSYMEEGQTVPPTKELKGNAWNAIGPSSTLAKDAALTLKSIEGSWSTLIAWNAETQSYEEAIIAPAVGSDAGANMAPCKGYWIWVTQDDVLSAISG